MRGTRGPVVVLVVSLPLLVFAACTKPALGRWFEPVGTAARGDGRAVVDAGSVRISAQEVAGGARADLLRKKTGATDDPFEVDRDARPVFRTFVLEIENRGSAPVEFNPSFCKMQFGSDKRYPLGYSELYTFLSTAIPDHRTVARFAPVLEELPVTVPPGGRLERLLVFNRVPPEAGKASLDLSGIRAGEADLGGRLEFARPRLDR